MGAARRALRPLRPARYPVVQPDAAGELALYGLRPVPLWDESAVEGLGSGSTDGLEELVAFALFDGVADPLPVGA
jgi:hypothetical protein